MASSAVLAPALPLRSGLGKVRQPGALLGRLAIAGSGLLVAVLDAIEAMGVRWRVALNSRHEEMAVKFRTVGFTERVAIVHRDGAIEFAKVTVLYGYEGLKRVEVAEA